MGVPDVGGTPHQVIVRHQAEQAGIGQIDGIVRSHPIIILAENIVHHRLAVYPKRIVLHRSITPLMMKDGITEQCCIPRINPDGLPLAGRISG